MLNGLVLPTRGGSRVDGLDTRTQGRDVRRRVGFCFTDPDAQIVMPTVAEDVAFGLRRRGLSKAEVAERVTAALATYGLAGHADHPAHLLSGGQKQLLALAAVLVTEPDVLVMDEPTTLLDLRNATMISRVVAGLPQQVLLVTHHLDLLDGFDRVLVFDDGRLVCDDEPAAAVASYRRSMAVSPLGLYVPGDSPVHRAPAGLKLVVMVAAGVGSVFLRAPWQVAVALAVVLLAYAVAGMPPRTVVRQVRPLLWVGLATAVFHVVVNGWQRAVVVVGVLAVLVLLAALVTLTTRTTALVDAVVTACRPLRVLRVDPDRVGLMIALGIRCVPVVVGLAEGVRDAQRARGLAASPRAFAVPLIVRSLRHADALGEALAARGLDD